MISTFYYLRNYFPVDEIKINESFDVNIFFDKKTLNIIGWQNIDIYQNLVITYLFDLKINLPLRKDQFKLPSIN